MHERYVGVAGVTTRAEVDACIDCFPSDSKRLLALGVLVSAKTLAGRTNNYPMRYPPVESVASIFRPHPRVLNLLHYSSDVAPTREVLRTLQRVGGLYCDGYQFNGAWPTTDDLKWFVRAFDVAPRIVLQVRPLVDGTFGNVWALLDTCLSAGVTDLLLDASGGRGVPLSESAVRAAVDGVREVDQKMGIGVAGGLCGERVRSSSPLLLAHINLDAERALRDGAEGGGRLDLSKVADYLRTVTDVDVGTERINDVWEGVGGDHVRRS